MLWTIAVTSLALWVLGLVSGLVLGPWVHGLLVLAVGALIVHRIRLRRALGT